MMALTSETGARPLETDLCSRFQCDNLFTNHRECTLKRVYLKNSEQNVHFLHKIYMTLFVTMIIDKIFLFHNLLNFNVTTGFKLNVYHGDSLQEIICVFEYFY